MISPPRLVPSLLVICVALLGCKPDAPAPSASSATSPRASASSPTAAGGASAAAPSSIGVPRPPARLDAKQRAAYRAALAAGRLATRKSHYGEAEAAFTAALAVQPGDPRALGERGYAAYLAKEYLRAGEDLYLAATSAEDRVLRAQIFYNLGLVREAEGLEAASAFVLSNQLNPTPAAQRKMAGKQRCLLDVDRVSEPSVHHGDWLAFFEAVKDFALREGENPPTTGAEAKKLLCRGSACTGASPWIVPVGEPYPSEHFFLVHESPTGLAVSSLIQTFTGRCSAEPTVKIAQNNGEIVVVETSEVVSLPMRMCFPETGEGHVCTENDGDDVSQQTACLGGTDTTTYAVFDLMRGVRTLRVTHDEAMEIDAKRGGQTTLALDAKALSVRGPGCNETFPLVADTAGKGPSVK